MIKLNRQIVEQNHFPDGTPLLKMSNFWDSETQTIEWFYEDMKELFSLYSIVKQIRSVGFNNVDLFMPYVPNARQDRIQDTSKDVFTLKWFCEIINSLNFGHVSILDIHSNVTPALLNNCYCINNEAIIKKVLSLIDVDMLFYPDNGACKKYSEYIKMPYAFGIKHRNWEDGKITGLKVIGDVQGKSILIVDDICSRGGTFKLSANALKENGATNIYLCVTHCENTIWDGDLLTSPTRLIDKVFTTNSIYNERENQYIEVIKLEDLLDKC